MKDAAVALTSGEIERFSRDGFLAVSRLTGGDDITMLRASYDRIFSDQTGREVGNQFDLAGTDEDGKRAVLPQILHPATYAPEMNTSELLVNAAFVARQILGPEATCEFAHAIFKPAGYGAETPWHQDAAYWDPAWRYTSISIWVPLQEATEENGCMEFVPGSHNLDVVRHRSINNDPRVHGLELHPDAMTHVQHPVRCPLPAGGATFHGPYMLHHTGANRSSQGRRALILNAGIPPVRRRDPLRFPWMEEKVTAREARARTAAERGIDPGAPPTGAVKKR